MASQKSISQLPLARQPKRQRGRDRVAAIMDAGAAVFAEKGYDAATMTEIAARSNTAIGSLYRFFPTKAVLAESLRDRYRQHLGDALDKIAGQAAGTPPAALPDALVDVMLGLKSERAAALALIDARSDAADRRVAFREGVRNRLAAILVTVGDGMPPARAAVMADVLFELMKASANVARQEQTDRKGGLVAEIRALMRLYLAHGLNGGGR